MKILILFLTLMLLSYHKRNDLRILRVSFYKEGKRVFETEGTTYYNSRLPIPVIGGKIYCDSISIKILEY